MTVVSDLVSPTNISINSEHRSITLTQFLPYTNYFDISQKTKRVDLIPTTKGSDINGLVFFAPAMAARSGYYRYFLDYLSSRGYIIYTFDFSGIDTSKSSPTKASDLTMQDWIVDLQTAVSWVLSNYGDQLKKDEFHLSDNFKKYYLCHSLGGQFFGFLKNQNQFDRFIGITSQNGYWRFYKTKWRYFMFWYLVQPILTGIFGYFPGKLVGFGEDIPPKIMNRWKKWCTFRNYFFDDKEFEPKFEHYSNKMLTIGFTDDPWATFDAIDDLYSHYSNADREHWEINPIEFSLQEIGHLGYFRPKSIVLWNKTVTWLEQ